MQSKLTSMALASFPGLNQLPIAGPIGSYQTAILYWGFYDTRYWRNYLHTHSFYEACYAHGGHGTYLVGDDKHKVAAGDLFIARPGQEHEIVSSRSDPLGIYYWAFSLNRGSPAAHSSADAVLDGFVRSDRLIVPNAQSLQPTLDLLTDEIGRKPAGYPVAVNHLVVKLLLDTARLVAGDISTDAPPPGRSETDAIVATATRYIRDNLARSINLRDVAAQVHFSERHLSRLFLKSTGQTVLEHITRQRIESASHLLLTTKWPVKKVAATVGYPDVRYFITLFRKTTGTTPAALRKRGGTAFR